MKKHFLLLLLLAILSCNNNKHEKIKADLTFSSISFASAYGASDEEYDKFFKKITNYDDNKKIKEYIIDCFYNYDYSIW